MGAMKPRTGTAMKRWSSAQDAVRKGQLERSAAKDKANATRQAQQGMPATQADKTPKP